MLKKNLALYLFGSNTSIFGDVILTTALALHIMKITGSPGAFAAIMSMAFLPRMLFTSFSGAIVDKLNSRKLMIFLDLLRGVLLLTCFINGDYSKNMVIALVVTFAAIDTFFVPASITIIPNLFHKDYISKVNSLDQSIRSSVNVISPLVASIIYATGGLGILLIIDAITFLLSAVSEYLLEFTEKIAKDKKKGSMVSSMSDAVKVIFGDKRVASLIFNGALSHLFLFTFIEVGMISLLMITFNKPEFHYGILQAVISVSAIISSIIAFGVRNKKSISEHINLGIIGMIVAVVLFIPITMEAFRDFIESFEFMPVIYLSIACFVMFMSFGYYAVFFRSFYQSEVPKEYLGRFTSIFMMLTAISRIAGLFIYGQLFEYNLIYYAIVVLGAGMIIKLLVHIPFISFAKRDLEEEH